MCSTDLYWLDPNGKYVFDYKKINQAHAWCLKTYIGLLSTKDGDPIKDPRGLRLMAPDTVLVVDNTNTSVAETAPYAALAQAFGHELSIITLLCDPEKAWKRNVHELALKDVFHMDYTLRTSIPHLPRWFPHDVQIVKEEPDTTEGPSPSSGAPLC